MKHAWIAMILGFGCSNSTPEPAPRKEPVSPSPKAIAAIERELDIAKVAKASGLEFVGTPVKQSDKFPANRWVRTELFGSRKPYIGYAYAERSGRHGIKGEDVSGLSDEQITAKLHASFPSSTMAPIPEGHPITPLTDAEIKKYGLPAEPDWVQHYR
jgi:hypothetical protein